MSDTSDRVSRATELAGGNRLRAALLLDRWAGVLRANDPGLARDLSAQARLMTRRERGLAAKPRKSKYRGWRLRKMGFTRAKV